MPELPHDIPDLRLAPVALAVDAVIEDLGRLSLEKLAWRVESYRDVTEITRDDRERWLLAQIKARVEMAGWELSVDDRGIRLRHREHTFVLGAPATFWAYLEGRANPQA
jgi:hypothetical protein